MMPKPRADLLPNTFEFEVLPLVKPTGFREYDARWWFGIPSSDKAPELNLNGVQALGLGMATLFHELGVPPKVVTGHDFRSISQPIKNALMLGLIEGGCEVLDVGLALSPIVYWSQFELDAACCAMVTASHNENGWTGVKMGANKPLTFGPEEMGRLKEIVLSGAFEPRAGGSSTRIEGLREKYIAAVADGVKLSRPIKVIAACGNGTAATFVVDVKSTGLYKTDPVLKENDVTVDYYKTGHSYIKRRTNELGALAGFEKSGHFFFRPPIGLGYDDGLVAAGAVLAMLDRNPDRTLSSLKGELGIAFTSLTMSPHCDDELKYGVIDEMVEEYRGMNGKEILGRKVVDVNTVNGARVTLEDGSWVLVRASSNKPELVVVVESLQSADDMRDLFHKEVKPRLGKHKEVGSYNQEI